MRTLSVIFAMCFLGCAGSEEEGTSPDPSETLPPSGETPPGTTPPTDDPSPEPEPEPEEPDLDDVTFARVWDETAQLRTCGGCHNDSHPTGLSFANEDAAFAGLVTNSARQGAPASGCPTLTERVVPGDPDSSLFFQVISGNCGASFNSMVLPPNARPLIEAWIEQGANR